MSRPTFWKHGGGGSSFTHHQPTFMVSKTLFFIWPYGLSSNGPSCGQIICKQGEAQLDEYCDGANPAEAVAALALVLSQGHHRSLLHNMPPYNQSYRE